MIWSVSTLLRFSGTPTPVCEVNLSMAAPSGSGVGADGREVGGRGEGAADGGRRGDERRHEVRPPALALAALEVAVRRRGRTLAGLEGVRVHAETHRAARAAPLGPGLLEDHVEDLVLRLQTDLDRAWHDEQSRVGVDLAAPDHGGGRAQVLDAAVGAGADEDGVDLDVAQRRARLETH